MIYQQCLKTSSMLVNVDLLIGICIGYMALKYIMYGQFSIKLNVYSFGVLILEIVSEQKNSCFRCGENVEDLLKNVADKPTMAFVIVMLNSYSLSLPVPSQPFDMSLGSEGNSRATGLDQYKNNSNKAPENEASLIYEKEIILM
ncbi:hypothetical protein PRUPE_6G184000 [Prunus persica]|uniref:Uncharacterized protein n=1 Tax=Prunus persica TaxID=3760 RepID=M5W3J1_PRUPE|nr:hypothetical protein PRUPE_6G184000 [Prunus persica]